MLFLISSMRIGRLSFTITLTSPKSRERIAFISSVSAFESIFEFSDCIEISPPNVKNGCDSNKKLPPQPFFCKAIKHLFAHRTGTKKQLTISVGLLAYISNDGMSAFSESSNDWLSPTTNRLDTYSAGSARTCTSLSCSAEQTSCALFGHGNTYKIKF